MARSYEESKRIMKELGIFSSTFASRSNTDLLDDATKNLFNYAELVISDAKVKILEGQDLSDEEIRVIRLCVSLLSSEVLVNSYIYNDNNSRDY